MPMTPRRNVSLLLAALALTAGIATAACGSSSQADPDVTPDAGHVDHDSDAGNLDAGDPDAGNPDAGNPDAGNNPGPGDSFSTALDIPTDGSEPYVTGELRDPTHSKYFKFSGHKGETVILYTTAQPGAY